MHKTIKDLMIQEMRIIIYIAVKMIYEQLERFIKANICLCKINMDMYICHDFLTVIFYIYPFVWC